MDPSNEMPPPPNDDETTITSDIHTVAGTGEGNAMFASTPNVGQGQTSRFGVQPMPPAAAPAPQAQIHPSSEDGSVTSGIVSMTGLMTADGSYFDPSLAGSEKDRDFNKQVEDEAQKVLSEYGMLHPGTENSKIDQLSGKSSLGASPDAPGTQATPSSGFFGRSAEPKGKKGPPPVATSGARMASSVKTSSLRIVRSLRKKPAEKPSEPKPEVYDLTPITADNMPNAAEPAAVVVTAQTAGGYQKISSTRNNHAAKQPPSFILVESDGSDEAQQLKKEDDDDAAPPPVEVCLGRRLNTVVVILAVVLLIAIAVACGALIAASRKQNTSSASASTTRDPSVFFFPPTTAPTGAVEAGNWDVNRCGGDQPEGLFLVEGEDEELSCEWLALETDRQPSICVPGDDAWELCRETCRNCDGVAEPGDGVTEPGEGTEPTPPPVIPPTGQPTTSPTIAPIVAGAPTRSPVPPTPRPSPAPTREPTRAPTRPPTRLPTNSPIASPTLPPTRNPTSSPIASPTGTPTREPTPEPTDSPVTAGPTPTPIRPRDSLISVAPTAVLEEIADGESSAARAASFIDETSQEMDDFRIIQRFALANLAFSTGSNRRLQAGWLEGNECDWSGVSCNDESAVTSVEVSDQNLSGTLPKSISMLEELQRLDISRNDFRGNIPSELGKLENLQALRLEYNNFSGNFAIELGNMKSLREWYMEYNSLSGPFPNAVVLALDNLEELSVFHNNLIGEVADAVCARGLEAFWIDCRELDSRCWTRCFFQCGGSTGVPCN